MFYKECLVLNTQTHTETQSSCCNCINLIQSIAKVSICLSLALLSNSTHMINFSIATMITSSKMRQQRHESPSFK